MCFFNWYMWKINFWFHSYISSSVGISTLQTFDRKMYSEICYLKNIHANTFLLSLFDVLWNIFSAFYRKPIKVNNNNNNSTEKRKNIHGKVWNLFCQSWRLLVVLKCHFVNFIPNFFPNCLPWYALIYFSVSSISIFHKFFDILRITTILLEFNTGMCFDKLLNYLKSEHHYEIVCKIIRIKYFQGLHFSRDFVLLLLFHSTIKPKKITPFVSHSWYVLSSVLLQL